MWEDYEDGEDDLDEDDWWDENPELEDDELCEQDAYGDGDCTCAMCQYYRNVGQ